MARLTDALEGGTAVHLLLCASTKMGKSDYVAQAALDGFTVIYIDADNGKGTLKKVLEQHPEALNRVLYLKTDDIYMFFKHFCETGIVRWNETQDKLFVAASAAETDNIIEIRPGKIPFGVIFVLDSWTSVAMGAMKKSASEKSVRLESMAGASQQVYGEAAIRLNVLLDIYQKVPFHTITQAHSLMYEIQEKQRGLAKEVAKQSEMIIRETIEVPKSASKPHGYEMGKYFGEIGWLTLDPVGRNILDFKKNVNRVGGGSPNGSGDPRGDYRFSKLFAQPVTFTEEQIAGFWKEYPAKDYVAPTNIGNVKTAVAPAATPAGELPAAGNKGSTLSMLLKKN